MRTAFERLLILALINLTILLALGWAIVSLCGGDCGGNQRPGAPWSDP